MDTFIKEIKKLEDSNKLALTSRYPKLLPAILESRRAARSMTYNLLPKYKLTKTKHSSWFHLTEHSSPLYRKYNKRELDEGKIRNIEIAIKNLNEVIIPPGKVFSFWKHVGRPTLKRGFKTGLVLSGGKLKEDTGGGLCQLSNLLAYMFACSECVFVERNHHSKDVFPDNNRTVPFASGATVFFNLIDLKVRNPYPFPLKLNIRTTDTQLRGSLSAPVQLGYFVKVEEKKNYFIESNITKKIYRCNLLHRVFYEKKTKDKIREEPLWLNIAQVMYDEKDIAQPVRLIS